MKTYRNHLLAVLAATITAAAASDPVLPPPPPLLLPVLDHNHNGELGPKEIAAAADSLARLDKNGDGKISHKELMPPPSPDLPPPPLGPIVKALDLNKDGALSAAEIEAAPESLLILDVDNDGIISRKELAPPIKA